MNNEHSYEQSRELKDKIVGVSTSDGNGVKLKRIIGTKKLNMLDPFLLLDAFESDRSQDYIGGFPSHPHRGFETVTYMLAGRMRHKDNAGNEGVIEPGGVQWMTAGKGIVHSEMPEQEQGLLHGFQLWVNLPAAAKMQDPAYQEFPGSKIPIVQMDNGATVRVIAGSVSGNKGDEMITGPVVNRFVDPTYLDISLPAGAQFTQPLDVDDNGFVYIISGAIALGKTDRVLSKDELGVLGPGDRVEIVASSDSRLLLVAGRPLQEPVARGGPFVMNTQAEIDQAFDDFRNNRF